MLKTEQAAHSNYVFRLRLCFHNKLAGLQTCGTGLMSLTGRGNSSHNIFEVGTIESHVRNVLQNSHDISDCKFPKSLLS